MRRSNVVGVNVRTVGSYAGVLKYALTLPEAFDAIHLLPIWEPGVVDSLYGIASWNLNTEFFSDELYELAPNLDSTERQLRAVRGTPGRFQDASDPTPAGPQQRPGQDAR